ncbi:MAG: TolC family protein [Deltaproteobacteria bacterium]|nr:TolC family protein [Deltaproteobacteria bacterium]
MRLRNGLWLVAVAAGCATAVPRPIDPARAGEDFLARSLDDPGLAAYVAANAAAPVAFPPAEWDLPALTLVAFYYHPELDVARAAVAVAQAAEVTAGAIPNPSIGVGGEFHAGPSTSGTPWTFGFSFDIPIETAGKRGYRVAHAERLTDVARVELAEAAWAVRSRLRAALVDHLLAVKESDAAAAEHDARSRQAELIARLMDVGEASRPDLDQARTETARAALEARTAAGRIDATRAVLAAALGLPVAALEGVAFAWPDLEAPPSPGALDPAAVQREGLLNRLDLHRVLAEYAAAEADLQLAVANQYPDVHIGTGWSWDQNDNKIALGISVPLPIFDQNQGPIAEAEARRAEVAARFDALQARAVGEIDLALARVRAAMDELAEADTLVAAVGAQTAGVERLFAAGAEDALAVAGARVQAAAVARARVDAVRKVQEAVGALEDALQRPVDGEANPNGVPPPDPGRASPADEEEAP